MALARGPYSQSIHGYRKIKKIGKGGFGTVYLVTKGGQRYALKEIVQEAESEKEVQILKNLKHVNIVSYIESFPGGLNKLYIVMEYCEMGNLRELITSKDPIGVEERFIVGIMTQVCRGMKYIHRKKVIHRDIKPPNVLATSRGDFKVGDFGLSKVLQSGGYTKTRCGTHGYISPECLAGLPYTFSSDMWAVGKVLSDLCSYKGKQDYSNDLRALNQNLLSREPRKRPTADEALSMLSNVNSASKGRHLSRVASPKGYPKYLRALLGKLQTDPSYQPTTDDIRTVFLNLNMTSSTSSSSESSYGDHGPKHVAHRSPRTSSSSESSYGAYGPKYVVQRAPKIFLGGHPFLGGGAFAGNYIPAFQHPVVYQPNIPILDDTRSQVFMQRNSTSRTSSSSGASYGTYGPKYASQRSPRTSSSSASSYGTYGPTYVSQRSPRTSSSSASSYGTHGPNYASQRSSRTSSSSASSYGTHGPKYASQRSSRTSSSSASSYGAHGPKYV